MRAQHSTTAAKSAADVNEVHLNRTLTMSASSTVHSQHRLLPLQKNLNMIHWQPERQYRQRKCDTSYELNSLNLN
jgi:hypothetical protein